MDITRRKSRAALISVLSNTTLVAAKLIVGFLIGSVSVISEAIHSAIDLVAALIALYAVRASGKAPDKEHNYGHGKIENVSGTIEAVLIFIAAAWIVIEAVDRLRHPRPLDMAASGVVVMFFSTVVNWWVSAFLFKVGKETDSVALQADAWHLRTDVYTSAGVMGGLVLITAGNLVTPGLYLDWLDPVAAIFVAGLIAKAAYSLTVQSGAHLLDAALPEEEDAWIRGYLQTHIPQISGYHKLRTRKSGGERFVDVHIQVNGLMSVKDSHDIAHKIITGIERQYPGSNVTIHVEPETDNLATDGDD